MRRHIVLARRHRRTQPARPVTRVGTISRDTTLRKIVRSDLAVPTRQRGPTVLPSSAPVDFQPNPYLDYGRVLTPEGGILIFYKELDEGFRRTLWRLFAWTPFTATEAYFLYAHSPVQSPEINIACFIAAAFLNWLVVGLPVEVYRSVEVRPDCLILGGQEIFWQRFMEKWPTFGPGQNGSQVLSGIYGTRFVEFLTVRPFDEYDRTPEIFAAHLEDAMKQLWTGLH